MAFVFGEQDIKKRKIPTLKFTNDNVGVYVFDDLVHPAVGGAMRQYLARGEYSYSYLYPDPYENMPEIPNSGNLHWRAFVSPANLIKMRIWKYIRDSYKSLPDDIVQGRRFLPYEATGTLLQRGDFPVAFKGDEDATDKIFIRIFLTPNMGKNAYSDQTFYDENDEIFASIHPKVNRIIAWYGNVSTLFRPPSMGNQQPEYSLFVKLTPDTTLFNKACEDFNEKKEKMLESKSLPFPFKNSVNKIDYDKINFADHLVGQYFDRNNNVVAFFDDIFPKEFVDAVRTYYTHYHSGLGYNPYDPASSETHDNVNWLIQLEPESVLNTPYIEMIKRMTAFLTNKTDWYPYDVSCNLIQHVHHTRIHVDCTNQEYEFTFLMYLNPNWTEDMYAETSFYQFDKETLERIEQMSYDKVDREGLESYDLLAAAIPKFGRIALFRNLIPHSARPPAPTFLAARYTFPVKLSESHNMGRAKMLREALEYKTDDVEEDPLYNALKIGEYAPYLKEEKRDWVEKHLQKMRDCKKKDIQNGVLQLEALLFPEKFRPMKTEL